MQTTQQQVIDRLGFGWAQLLYDKFLELEAGALVPFLAKERSTKVIYPESKDVFKAYKLTSIEEVKVCILGQDPYINGEAHGLAFSCKKGFKTPPSLKIILKEVACDLQDSKDRSTDLTEWATQGVFLLNTILTVEKGNSLSHGRKGWEEFTKATIELLNSRRQPVVFMLWGSYAKGYEKYIDTDYHLVLKANHPAAECYGSGGYYGCNHFSKANEYLISKGYGEIKW